MIHLRRFGMGCLMGAGAVVLALVGGAVLMGIWLVTMPFVVRWGGGSEVWLALPVWAQIVVMIADFLAPVSIVWILVETYRAGRDFLDPYPEIPETGPYLRPEVLAFARLMESRLRAKDSMRGRSGWRADGADALYDRLADQASLLGECIHQNVSQPTWPMNALKRAVHVGNYAMMIVDVLVGLGPADRGEDDARS